MGNLIITILLATAIIINSFKVDALRQRIEKLEQCACLTTFEHDRQDVLATCLRKAADAVDKVRREALTEFITREKP